MARGAGRSGVSKAPAQPKKSGGGGGIGKRGRGGGRGGKTGGKGSSRKKGPSADEYESLTNLAEITGPARNLINPALKGSWEVHRENGMALIFDTISPVRKYNRDQPYREDGDYPFAVYDPNPEEDPNVTENDDETEPLNPYEPIVVHQTYRFKMGELLSFVWLQDETECIEYGRLQKIRGRRLSKYVYTVKFIPCAYIRVIHQLSTEIDHAEYNKGHEAQRRASYAQRVLNALGQELDSRSDLNVDGPGAVSWRSIVLTPILQRHLHGIPDSYGPAIYRALLPPSPGFDPDRELTIGDVTRFYLNQDPTDASLASIYYRNLVYRWEARWHLAIVFKRADIRDVACHGDVLFNQKIIIRDAVGPQEPGPTVPPLSETEYAVIFCEDIHFAFPHLLPGFDIIERAEAWAMKSLAGTSRTKVLRQAEEEDNGVDGTDTETGNKATGQEQLSSPTPAIQKHSRDSIQRPEDGTDGEFERELNQVPEVGDVGQST